jgi:hypothetical protein
MLAVEAVVPFLGQQGQEVLVAVATVVLVIQPQTQHLEPQILVLVAVEQDPLLVQAAPELSSSNTPFLVQQT